MTVRDQESIHSSTTPDPEEHMGKCQKHKKISHEREPSDQPLISIQVTSRLPNSCVLL